MADTRQGVYRALERTCPLRRGERWPHPRITAEKLRGIQGCTRAIAAGEVRNDVVVTSYQCLSSAAGKLVELPLTGVPVAPFFTPFGGRAHVLEVCNRCEANVAK